MRRLIVAIATLSLVLLAPAPAQAVTVTVTVPGFDYPTGLKYLTGRCGANPAVAPTLLYRSGGRIGTHATGRGFAGSSVTEAGVLASVAAPSTLTSISFATYHPAGPDPDTAADGHFYAEVDNDGNVATFYYAYQALDVQIGGWGTWSNLATQDLNWYYWNGATSSLYDTGKSVPEFASTLGIGSVARVGFMFGCNGRDYYMDDFRVTTTARTTAYDFEAVPTVTYLSGRSKHHGGHFVYGLRKLTLTVGQGHWLAGDSKSLGDGVTGGGWFNGTARLFQTKPSGRSSYRHVSNAGYTTTKHAWFKIRPKKNTVYKIDTPGTSTFDTSSSKTLVVNVKRRVQMRIADKTVTRGNPIKVSGSVIPGVRGVKVSLQKKVGARWTKIAKERTHAKGRYTFRTNAKTAGKWKVRIVAASGKGNLGNKSPRVTITVKLPKPKPSVPPDVVSVETPVPETHEQIDEPKAGRVMLRLSAPSSLSEDPLGPPPSGSSTSSSVTQTAG